MSRPVPPVRCPTCGKRGDWFAGAFGPFCSQRCRLIDLGKWLGGEHVISEPLRPEHFAGHADLPPGPHLDRVEPEDRD
ncbi:MAG: DNA gyrase inhibitor YacG [Limisphaerales bacterium]